MTDRDYSDLLEDRSVGSGDEQQFDDDEISDVNEWNQSQGSDEDLDTNFRLLTAEEENDQKQLRPHAEKEKSDFALKRESVITRTLNSLKRMYNVSILKPQVGYLDSVYILPLLILIGGWRRCFDIRYTVRLFEESGEGPV
jgi:hypothetical protein